MGNSCQKHDKHGGAEHANEEANNNTGRVYNVV